jgi:hypothetical protein
MYNVIILAEQRMSRGDADEVTQLHEAIEDQRHYHVLIPCENAALQVESTLGSFAATDVTGPPPTPPVDADVEQVQGLIDSNAESDVRRSVEMITATGHEADGSFTSGDPITALESLVRQHRADEVIVMTRPHVVAEFFHTDWSSRARRRLGVPVLHLVEHEPLDAEAGGGEGITGM